MCTMALEYNNLIWFSLSIEENFPIFYNKKFFKHRTKLKECYSE